MKPRADWVCLSLKCRHDGQHECQLETCPADGSQSVYELYTTSTRCSVCGSKRIKRLFNAVNVIGTRNKAAQPEADWRLTSSSHAARADALLQDSFDQRDKLRAASRELPSFEAGGREQDVSLPGGKRFVVPSAAEVGQMFGLSGKGQPMNQMEIHREMRRDRLGVPSLLHGINQKDVPTVVVGKER